VSELAQQVIKIIRDIPDFPKPGVIFKDITPLLQNRKSFHQVIDWFAEPYLGKNQIDLVIGVESRGFMFASPTAFELNAGVVPVRKPGKLPWKTNEASYQLEYGIDRLQIHQDAIQPGQNVLIVDDVLATGGTAGATIELVQQLGGNIIEVCFLIELGFLNGRNKVKGLPVRSLIQY
jgi:adenine phosphoribosyltransferase